MNPGRVVPDDVFADMAADTQEMLTKKAGRKLGFALIIFDTENGGPIQYVSNGSRDDMFAALRDMLGQMASQN